jgi:hypothetical protein
MSSEEYVPDERILEACPSCGSGRIACVMHTELDFCMSCHRVWERLPPDEPYTIDGEQLAFNVPCDNCAFRGNSEERADAEGWRYLQNTLARGGEFYCHKGVPFTVKSGAQITDPHSRPFEFPKVTASVDLAGKCHPYQMYDKTRMRLCRGYLNAHVAPLLKKVFHDETV